MKNISLLFYLYFVLFLTNCTAKNPVIEKKIINTDDKETENAEVRNHSQTTEAVTFENSKEKTDLLISKETKEAIYFAASLEREALKLVNKKSSYEASTLFQVLSFILEVKTGTKKSAPLGLDCSRFDIQKNKTILHFLKTCQKPHLDLAEMELDQENIKIVFKIKEWASVVGSSVALTQPDIVCRLKLKNKKLDQMSCQNWAYVLRATSQASEEIRLTKMIFSKEKENQFELEGGFFLDLIERRHLKINVPLQGHIKRLEKELEVRDDFADLLKNENHENKGNELNEVENKSKEKNIEKNDQKGDEKSSEKNSEKNTEEGVESPPQSEQPVKIEAVPQTSPGGEIIKEVPYDEQGEKNENTTTKSGRGGRGR